MIVHLYSKFQLDNWCTFLLSQCPCLYSIGVYSERTKNSGYLVTNIFDWTFYTVTSRHIHGTHFILMCKEFFFPLWMLTEEKKVYYRRAVSFFLETTHSFFFAGRKKVLFLLLSYIRRERANLAFFHSTKNVFLYKVKRRRRVFKTRIDAYLSLLESFFEFLNIFFLDF